MTVYPDETPGGKICYSFRSKLFTYAAPLGDKVDYELDMDQHARKTRPSVNVTDVQRARVRATTYIALDAYAAPLGDKVDYELDMN